jgi:hypothetical protein
MNSVFSRLLGLAVLVVTAAHAQNVLQNGLVAYYPFDGNANDQIGGSNGNPIGVLLARDRFGVEDRAYRFNGGITSYVEFATAPLTNLEEFTISAWVAPAKLPQAGGIVTLGFDDGNPANANGVGLSVLSDIGLIGSSFVGTVAGIQHFPSGYIFTAEGQWHHVVMTRSSGTIRFYVDGVATSNFSTAAPRNATAFRIGAAQAATEIRYFQGSIDNVGIFNRALSANQVEQLYSEEVTERPQLDISIASVRLQWAAAPESVYQLQWASRFRTGQISLLSLARA